MMRGNKPLAFEAHHEIELLLCCARIDVDGGRAARVRELVQRVTNWEYLLQAALQHRVMPLLYWQLKALCPEAVPEDFMNRLRDYFFLNAARNHLLTEELCKLLKLLAKHNIAAVPYKGPALAAAVYGDLALRQFTDLDLMIHRRDVPQATQLLRSQGYQRQYQFTPAQEAAYLRSDCEHLFVKGDGPVFVDLHWALVRSYFSLELDMKGMWDRLEGISLDDMKVQTFGPEDLLMILCVHAGKDLWEKLIWVCDVAELINTHRRLDWEQVVAVAHASGTQRMLFLGLFLAHNLLGTELPAHIRRRAQADPAIETMAEQVQARLLRDSSRPVGALDGCRFLCQLHPQRRDRMRYLLRFAITTNPADWAFIPLPDQFFFLHYLLRPVRLLSKHLIPDYITK